jgi:hypothetical protein
MKMEVDIGRVVDVETMMLVVVALAVALHRDLVVLDIVYHLLVLIDHEVLVLAEKMVQFED